VSQTRIEGGGNDQGHIDERNMRFDRLVSNASSYMSAMRLTHVPQRPRLRRTSPESAGFRAGPTFGAGACGGIYGSDLREAHDWTRSISKVSLR
jgi:hypothetical protein